MSVQLDLPVQSVNTKFHVFQIRARTLEFARMFLISVATTVLALKSSLELTVSSEFRVLQSHATMEPVSTTKTMMVILVHVRSVTSDMTARHQFHVTTINAKTTQRVQTLKT